MDLAEVEEFRERNFFSRRREKRGDKRKVKYGQKKPSPSAAHAPVFSRWTNLAEKRALSITMISSRTLLAIVEIVRGGAL